MLFAGIYIDPEVLLVSQANPKARDINRKLEAKRRPNYGLERWYTEYQGSLPNVYSAHDPLVVGYEALERDDGHSVRRLDEHYFKSLLESDTAASSYRVWEAILVEIRRNYLNSHEPVSAVLYPIGIDFRVGPPPSLPWHTSQTCKSQVEQALSRVSGKLGFTRLLIADDPRATIKALVGVSPHLQEADLLLDIGYKRQEIWRIRDPQSGSVELAAIAPGLCDLVRMPGSQQKEAILACCQKAIVRVGYTSVGRLVVAGVGSDLFDEKWKKDLKLEIYRYPDARFLDSFAAASYSYLISTDKES